MRIMQSERRLCTCCMEEHEVKTVCMREHVSFKNVQIDFDAIYCYCDIAEEYYAEEEQMRINDIALKDAYRKSQGLLTSKEIGLIRKKYGISQTDLCTLLGWGGKTVTRYESYQVQDRAHDTILKKLDRDPEWFLELLMGAKEHLLKESYQKYYKIATLLYENDKDCYLRKAIEAEYAKFRGNKMAQGNTGLSLNKVVDVIRYFAASVRVTNLYKVKLMKLMWYADALSYKKRGHAITGLVYQALPMGAVPIGHDSIIDLKGIPCEEVDLGETYAYYFRLPENSDYPFLEDEDKEILGIIIEKFGKMRKSEIVEYMHKERAYRETAPRGIISFQYAEDLRI